MYRPTGSFFAQTVGIVTAIAVSLMLAFAAISYHLITKPVTGLETQQTRDRVKEMVNEISRSLQALQAKAGDLASTDQTSAFFPGSIPSSVPAWLQAETLHSFQGNFLLLLNTSGHLVHSQFFDLEKNQPVAEDSEVLRTITDSTTLVQATGGYGRIMASGFLKTGSGKTLLMAAAPVTGIRDQGAIRGVLVLGRFLETEAMALRQRHPDLVIELHPFHAAQTGVAADLITTRECLDPAKPCVRAISRDAIAGYAVLRDLQEEPVLILEVICDRVAFQAALSLWRQQSGFMVVLVCGCVLVLLGLLSLLVFRKLKRLLAEIESVFENNVQGQRVCVRGTDQIGRLAGRINATLELLEQCRNVQQDNEQYFNTLLDAINCGILVVDAEQKTIVDGNTTATAMLGCASADILGKNGYDQICSSQTDWLSIADRQAQREDTERIVFRADGTTLPVLSRVSTVARGGAQVLVESFIDISGLKEAQHQLQESEGRYRQLFEDGLIGNCISASDGSIIDCNPAFALMLGYQSVAEAMKSNARYHYFSAEDHLALRTKLQEEKMLVRHHWTLRHLNGNPLYCTGNLRGIFNQQGDLVQIRSSVLDETSWVILEKERRQNQKMEAIGTLAGGIAHDFNNILAGIIGFTELLVRDLADRGTPETKLYLDNILSAGERASDLIKQILAFSRQSEIELRPIHLRQAISEVVQLMRASLPATITIEKQLESDAVVMADQVQIHQIIMNLCTNAGHAMKATGGVLALSLEDVTLDQRFASQHQDLEPGAYVLIAVSDTGPGIPDKVLEHIFDPFFTTRAQGEGTGIGLSLVHGIVKAMKGLITVASKLGRGTRFEIYLPLIDAAFEPVPMEENTAPTGTERIVFIEDDLFLMEIGKEILAGLGYQAIGFSGGAAALDYILNHADQVDLVVTDMVMPDVGGLDLSARIQEEGLPIPIVLCTGYSEGLTREHVALFGVCDFLVKPVTVHTLAVKVRTVLDRYRAISNT